MISSNWFILDTDFLPPIVTFVGIVSNIYTVCKSASFLAWICKLPSPVVGIISVGFACKVSIFAERPLISELFIGHITTCVVGSTYTVAPYLSPSFGAL